MKRPHGEGDALRHPGGRGSLVEPVSAPQEPPRSPPPPPPLGDWLTRALTAHRIIRDLIFLKSPNFTAVSYRAITNPNNGNTRTKVLVF